jgi:hypothetical protein
LTSKVSVSPSRCGLYNSTTGIPIERSSPGRGSQAGHLHDCGRHHLLDGPAIRAIAI